MRPDPKPKAWEPNLLSRAGLHLITVIRLLFLCSAVDCGRKVTVAQARLEHGLVVPDPRERPTLTIKEAAALLGISLHGAYDAAHRGELPVIWIGRRMLVPTAGLLAMVGLDDFRTPNGGDGA